MAFRLYTPAGAQDKKFQQASTHGLIPNLQNIEGLLQALNRRRYTWAKFGCRRMEVQLS